VVGAKGFELSTSWSRTNHVNSITLYLGVAYGIKDVISLFLVVPDLYLLHWIWTGSNRRPPVCKAEESIPTTTLVIPKSHRLQQFGDLLSLNSYPNALKTFDFVHSWCTAYSAYTRLDLHPLRCLLNVCVDDAFFVALSGFSFPSNKFTLGPH
jgi:hypothetical protein